MRKLIMLALFATMCFSCNKNTGEALSEINPFIHVWNLNLITGDLTTPEVFEDGDIIFDFKKDNTLSIAINVNIPGSSQFPFRKDTVINYKYELVKMELDGIDYTYTVNDNYLTLNNTEDDGILLQFVK